MKRIWERLFPLILLIGVLTTAWSQSRQDISNIPDKALFEGLEVPRYQGPVVDLAGVLKPSEAEVLIGKSIFLQLATTTQLAILIIPELKGEVLEKYSLRVANTWKLGRCDINSGVLILMAMKDRALRIEVGLGLESILTNAACKRIIEEDMVPLFKAGDFYGGLDSGVTSISNILTSSQEYRDIISRIHPCPGAVGPEPHE